MSDISSLLNDLYAKDSTVHSLEKTAEERLHAALYVEDQTVEANTYGDLSDGELMKLASDLGLGEQAEDVSEDLEKTAADMLGGQIMAHSMIHEFTLVKEAMVAGNCRVCKDTPRDLDGSSICSGCLGQ
jgi:hypothetical protein